MEAKRDYNRMDLSIVSMISLLFICKFEKINIGIKKDLPGDGSIRNQSSFEQHEFHAY